MILRQIEPKIRCFRTIGPSAGRHVATMEVQVVSWIATATYLDQPSSNLSCVNVADVASLRRWFLYIRLSREIDCNLEVVLHMLAEQKEEQMKLPCTLRGKKDYRSPSPSFGTRSGDALRTRHMLFSMSAAVTLISAITYGHAQ